MPGFAIPKNALFPKSRDEFRRWLAKHHARETEVWLVYLKVGVDEPSIRYDEAVEEALCFGWIDGLARGIDERRHMQRFTPRKPKSNWSASNLRRVARLIEQGLMTPAGLVFAKPALEEEARTGAVMRAEAEAKKKTVNKVRPQVPKDFAAALKQNAKAQQSWDAWSPGYQRLFVKWIEDAKREETRAKRVEESVRRVAAGIKTLL
ncbi:MAG: YdeI/OmpD-associated family protein [Deltaproteobacteria bacterium]|nr:YdeI/OmpD-associated family protein [Deltaproteobacteria bacterium]